MNTKSSIRIILVLFCLVFITFSLKAQTVNPFLPSTANLYYTTLNEQHIYISIGEVMTETFLNNGNSFLTQGVLQPSETIISSIDSISFEEEDWSIYPNPFSFDISINFNAVAYSKLQLMVYNVVGILVYEEKLTLEQGNYIKEVDLSLLPNGIYCVYISESSAKRGIPKLILKTE